MKIIATTLSTDALYGTVTTIALGNSGGSASGAGTVTGGDPDNGTDVITDPPILPVEKRDVQIEKIAFGVSVFAAPRNNREVSFRWQVERQHTTANNAAKFRRLHAALVPIAMSMVITLDDGSTTETYPAAYMEEVACIEWSGIRTRFQYSLRAVTMPTS